MRKFGLTGLILLLGLMGCGQTVPEDDPMPIILDALPAHAWETMGELMAAEPPATDLSDLASRLTTADVTLPAAKENGVGDQETFWYLRAAQFNEQISATLRYQSDQLNLWVGEGAKVSDGDLEDAAGVLETEILPTTRNLFGQEIQPGIDGDFRLNILHLDAIGGTSEGVVAAGYFFIGDRVPSSVNPYSNEREMLYIGLDTAKVGSDDYFGTIAHELEHLIHDTVDSNEAAWVDEGMAVLSAAVNGGTVEQVNNFAESPDLQLNNWPTENTLAHYGASYLFSQYLIDRFGEEAMSNVVDNGDNGFRGYAAVLTAQNMSVDQFFGDWVTANYLTSHVDMHFEPYTYATTEIPELPVQSVEIPSEHEGTVHQYGVDYIKFKSPDPVTFSFNGSTQVKLMDVKPFSGDYFWTTYPADRSDMTLTRAFDLTAASSPTATLTFNTWYDIEEGWDYGYILASTDGGNKWDILSDPFYATGANPQGNNFGRAYTGQSFDFKNQTANAPAPEWTSISINLNEYVGQNVLIRFEYVTDQAVHGAGWAIDDITIPEIGYSADFESGMDGWLGSGWLRHTNTLPQQYLVQVITLDESSVAVEQLTLDDSQAGEMVIDAAGQEIIITISGITPITTQRTGYQVTLK